MDEAKVFQALSDATRLEILRLLAPAPMNVTRIVGHLACAQPAVSRHLKILREAALIRGERKGKEIEYSVDAEAVLAAAGCLERLLGAGARGGAAVAAGATGKAGGKARRAASGAGPGAAPGAAPIADAGSGPARVTARRRPARDFVSREAEYIVKKKPRDLDDFLL